MAAPSRYLEAIEQKLVFLHPLFHGILAITTARPQKPLSPAKINPAPKNPLRRKKLGLTNIQEHFQ
jgi:hypothetical protein